MRWNKVITLLTPAEKYQDAAGVWHEGERVPRTVFCNEYIIGVVAQAHLRSSDVRSANATEPVDMGLRNEHMIQLRSIDYHSEDQCVFEGDEYEVMYVSGGGEMTMLTIGQKIGNEESGSYE